jgi:alpha/beta superfamily hydrolase
VSSLSLHTSDGHTLAADLAEPTGAVRGGVVLCHPHPLYGGNRFHPVVDALFRALPTAGFRTVRFDFRAAHSGGVGERNDVIAALDALAEPGTAGLPLHVVGYSFGALVALGTEDARIAGVVAIAPPLTPDAPAHAGPALVLSPRHDQFCPPEQAAAVTADWPDTTVDAIEGADHFLVGAAAAVATRTLAWLTRP